MFVDSDDYLLPDYVESHMSALAESGADYTVAGYTRCNERGESGRKLGLEGSGVPWGKVYKREMWERVRFPEGFWYEDTVLVWYVLPGFSSSRVEDFGYMRRIHPGQITEVGRGRPKSVDTYWVAEELAEWNRLLGMLSVQEVYNRFVGLCGFQVFDRAGSFLGEEGLRLLFTVACDYIESAPEFAGLTTTRGGRQVDLDHALRTRNYQLWKVASGF